MLKFGKQKKLKPEMYTSERDRTDQAYMQAQHDVTTRQNNRHKREADA